jgi:hypothetical protein
VTWGDEGVLRSQIALGEMEIRSAYSTSSDADLYLSGAWQWGSALDQT